MEYSIQIALAVLTALGLLTPTHLASAGLDTDFILALTGDIVVEVEVEEERDALHDWIDKLAIAESGGDPDVSIIDTNSKRSTGCLQFQDATWFWMGDVYNVNTNVNNLTDCKLQKELAYKMISDDYDNWKHWRCSVVGCPQFNIPAKVGLPPHVVK